MKILLLSLALLGWVSLVQADCCYRGDLGRWVGCPRQYGSLPYDPRLCGNKREAGFEDAAKAVLEKRSAEEIYFDSCYCRNNVCNRCINGSCKRVPKCEREGGFETGHPDYRNYKREAAAEEGSVEKKETAMTYCKCKNGICLACWGEANCGPVKPPCPSIEKREVEEGVKIVEKRSAEEGSVEKKEKSEQWTCKCYDRERLCETCNTDGKCVYVHKCDSKREVEEEKSVSDRICQCHGKGRCISCTPRGVCENVTYCAGGETDLHPGRRVTSTPQPRTFHPTRPTPTRYPYPTLYPGMREASTEEGSVVKREVEEEKIIEKRGYHCRCHTKENGEKKCLRCFTDHTCQDAEPNCV